MDRARLRRLEEAAKGIADRTKRAEALALAAELSRLSDDELSNRYEQAMSDWRASPDAAAFRAELEGLTVQELAERCMAQIQNGGA